MPLSGEGEYAHDLVLKHTLTDNTSHQSFKFKGSGPSKLHRSLTSVDDTM